MEIDLTQEEEQQQQHQPAAAPGRQQLADSGQQQLQALLQSSKALLDAYGDIQPTTECQQKLAALQQAYLAVSQDIRATLQQCEALEQQESAASAAGETCRVGIFCWMNVCLCCKLDATLAAAAMLPNVLLCSFSCTSAASGVRCS
jgi:hypothetical protein